MTEPKLYELSYVLKNAEEQALVGTLEQIRKYIEEKSGRSLEESRLQKRRLAYPVKKDFEGFFGNIKFFLKPEDLPDLKDRLNRESTFIRHMITVAQPYGSEPRAHTKKIKRAPETKAADVKEIDKKLEEILG